MATEQADLLAEDVARLSALEEEYNVTVRVLAVLVERVMQLTGSSEVHISDAALADQPDLSAWRPNGSVICLTTSR